MLLQHRAEAYDSSLAGTWPTRTLLTWTGRRPRPRLLEALDELLGAMLLDLAAS
jgi:hypothetical protein